MPHAAHPSPRLCLRIFAGGTGMAMVTALGLAVSPLAHADPASGITGIGYAPSATDPADHDATAGTAGTSLNHPMALSYGSGGIGEATTGSTSTALDGGYADDLGLAAGDGTTAHHHIQIHGSISAFAGSRGMVGSSLEAETGPIGNTGIRAALSVSGARLPDLKVPGHSSISGGNTQSASLALSKDFGDGISVGVGVGYARLNNSPYGYGGRYGYGGYGYGGGYGGPLGGFGLDAPAFPTATSATSDSTPAPTGEAGLAADVAADADPAAAGPIVAHGP